MSTNVCAQPTELPFDGLRRACTARETKRAINTCRARGVGGSGARQRWWCIARCASGRASVNASDIGLTRNAGFDPRNTFARRAVASPADHEVRLSCHVIRRERLDHPPCFTQDSGALDHAPAFLPKILVLAIQLVLLSRMLRKQCWGVLSTIGPDLGCIVRCTALQCHRLCRVSCKPIWLCEHFQASSPSFDQRGPT